MMRLKAALGICFAVLVLGTSAGGASAAKSVLWLSGENSHVRLANGAAVSAELYLGECENLQLGTLVANGQPSDELRFKEPTTTCHGESEKLSGTLTIDLTSKEVAKVTTTLHLLTEKWCVYTFSKLDAPLESEFANVGDTEITGKLDKAASFGAGCQSTMHSEWLLIIGPPSSSEIFRTEITG
jgi:hypothetical protein